ncbi:hypothetical protein [uncultured Aquimarina sp.]|uniref:hypothetical protein n=1 Tax=uncultured Aquimarina sp. TaxID=575652 RepID=UPI002625B00B|nr:hypothetical protein [uncultured Aquimarina sp.]
MVGETISKKQLKTLKDLLNKNNESLVNKSTHYDKDLAEIQIYCILSALKLNPVNNDKK